MRSGLGRSGPSLPRRVTESPVGSLGCVEGLSSSGRSLFLTTAPKGRNGEVCVSVDKEP